MSIEARKDDHVALTGQPYGTLELRPHANGVRVRIIGESGAQSEIVVQTDELFEQAPQLMEAMHGEPGS